MRTLISELKPGTKAEIQGWLHKKRKLGGLNFILVRDRSGVVQILVKDDQEMEILRGMQIGSVVKVMDLTKNTKRNE